MKSTDLVAKFREIEPKYEKILRLKDPATKEKLHRGFLNTLKVVKDDLRKNKSKKELLEVLRWQNQRGQLKDMSPEWHELNQLEADGINTECELHRRIPSGRYSHLNVGEHYKYRKTWSPADNQNIMEVFSVIIRTSEQRITPQVRQKMKLGLNVHQDEFLPNLELHDKIILKEIEWSKYFRHIEEVTLENLESFTGEDHDLEDGLAI